MLFRRERDFERYATTDRRRCKVRRLSSSFNFDWRAGKHRGRVSAILARACWPLRDECKHCGANCPGPDDTRAGTAMRSRAQTRLCLAGTQCANSLVTGRTCRHVRIVTGIGIACTQSFARQRPRICRLWKDLGALARLSPRAE